MIINGFCDIDTAEVAKKITSKELEVFLNVLASREDLKFQEGVITNNTKRKLTLLLEPIQ